MASAPESPFKHENEVEMFRASERTMLGLACAGLIALSVACGDDSSSDAAIEMGGAGGQAGSTVTAGKSGGAGGATAGSTAGRSAAGTGSPAGRGAAGSGAAGSGTAGRASGGTGGRNDDDDAGVPAGGTGGAGAGGSSGAGGRSAGSGGSGGGGGAAGSGSGSATFTEVYAIFMQSCAGSTCHVMATRPGEGLSMADKMTAYTNLVGVNAGACSGEKRVVAGDPAKSELMHTLERTQIGMCRNTPRMPEGKPMLAADQLAKVRSWIQAGAMNN